MTSIDRHLLAMIVFGVMIGLSPAIGIHTPAIAEVAAQRVAGFSAKVQTLVVDLGAAEFRRRERAEREIIALGPDAVKVIDSLSPSDDPEVRSRLKRIRYVLVGYLDNLRSYLAAIPPMDSEANQPLPPLIHHLIEQHQPKSGNYLLSLIVEEKLHRAAINAFVDAWSSMSQEQLEGYFGLLMQTYYEGRPKFPEGVGGSIELGYRLPYGGFSWPDNDDNIMFHTTTTHYVDGQVYKKAFEYDGPGACSGWIDTAAFTRGSHEFRIETTYTYTCGSRTIQSKVTSPTHQFEIIDADAPDDLIATADAELDAGVRASLRWMEVEATPWDRGRDPLGVQRADPWEPQITWRSSAGASGALHTPIWRVKDPVPADLCFDVELRVDGTDQVYPCDPIVVIRGESSTGHVSPKDVPKICEEQSGFVKVRIVLRPSRVAALTDPAITKYYGGTIESDVLRMKVD